MNFRAELAAAVMAGVKTVTRRMASENPRSPWYHMACGMKVGQTYAVCPGRGKHAIGRVRIVAVQLETLGHLSDAEAQLEGFADAVEFVDAWTAINGHYKSGTPVWRVQFERIT